VHPSAAKRAVQDDVGGATRIGDDVSMPVRLLDHKRSEMKGRGFAGRRPLRVLLAGIVTLGFLGITLTSHPSIATSSFDPMQCAPSDLGNLLVVTSAAFWSWSFLGVPYVRL
jgi:hypothetical protein